MNKLDFFEAIISPYTSREEQIIALLKARGFLIDHDERGFYLSDNAAVEDIEYLSKGLKEYSLGELSGCSFVSNLRERKIICDRTARITINKECDVRNAILFFEESGRVGFECCYMAHPWSEFVFRDHGVKIPVRYLEPYVAFYVKAVSSCGVLTDFSCDGNHASGGRIIVGAAYPYNIWHEQIWNQCINYSGKIFNGLRFSEATQYEIYYAIYKIACWLYETRFKLRTVKRLACGKIPKRDIQKNNKEKAEKAFVAACKFESITKAEVLDGN